MRTMVTVLGTRPEIIKFSPLLPLFDRHFRHILIHTGQHYDQNMDRIFFKELRLKAPQHFLNVGSGSQGVQTARMLETIEPILIKSKAQCVSVLGDTNSTLAGALAAAKLNIPIAHIESGCRSFNRKMPEETNRVMVDHISEWLFAPDSTAVHHMKREGLSSKKIHLVGNTGLDATRRTMQFTLKNRLARFGVRPGGYILATMHRAENTNELARFARLIDALNELSKEIPIVFPIHPRTRAVMKKAKIRLAPTILASEPIGNIDFITLLQHCVFVMSDSGGVQEEAAVVNRPCLVLREDTEWTRLVKAGKNFLVGTQPKPIVALARRLVRSKLLRDRIARKKAPLQFGASQKILNILRKSARP
jgi:UDP-N-acetylglucosamine 2-epimerase (non-hydrolysing)